MLFSKTYFGVPVILKMSEWMNESWSIMSDSLPPVVSDSLQDYSVPGFSVHGIFQARILEWVAISFSRGSSWLRGWTWVSCTAGRIFTIWAMGNPIPLMEWMLYWKELIISLWSYNIEVEYLNWSPKDTPLWSLESVNTVRHHSHDCVLWYGTVDLKIQRLCRCTFFLSQEPLKQSGLSTW